jgi:uncharacterized protein YbjT (DUF2867 family)
MKITITGSLGHISKPLAIELVQKEHAVTVISSNPERQKEIEALGATAAIGTMEDVPFLTAAFAGADAVYTMIPPPAHAFGNPNFDVLGEWGKIANNLAGAIEQSGVKRVVHLSSIGAHMDKDSGILIGHYNAEAILNKLPEVGITFMRPVGFYYNLLAFIPVIKGMGVIASNYGGDAAKPWVSPIDIAAAVAEEIVTPLTGKKVLYVASEEISCNEIAGILGEAIGKPDLKWVLIPGEQLKSGMEQAGVPKQFAAGLVEMNEAIQSGLLYEDYYKHRPVLGKVKVKDYAAEFAAAYNQ